MILELRGGGLEDHSRNHLAAPNHNITENKAIGVCHRLHTQALAWLPVYFTWIALCSWGSVFPVSGNYLLAMFSGFSFATYSWKRSAIGLEQHQHTVQCKWGGALRHSAGQLNHGALPFNQSVSVVTAAHGACLVQAWLTSGAASWGYSAVLGGAVSHTL